MGDSWYTMGRNRSSYFFTLDSYYDIISGAIDNGFLEWHLGGLSG